MRMFFLILPKENHTFFNQIKINVRTLIMTGMRPFSCGIDRLQDVPGPGH